MKVILNTMQQKLRFVIYWREILYMNIKIKVIHQLSLQGIYLHHQCLVYFFFCCLESLTYPSFVLMSLCFYYFRTSSLNQKYFIYQMRSINLNYCFIDFPNLVFIMKIILSFFIVIIALLFIPKESSFYSIPTPTQQDLQIYQDSYGIKHIIANSRYDVLFAQGWCHAKDRLWTLHIRKAIIESRLSQIFGQETIPIDFGSSKVSFETIPQQLKDDLQAYSDGINHYARSLRVLPFQFYLLWDNWRDWVPENSLGLVKFLFYAIQFDWMNDIARSILTQKLGPYMTQKVFPSSPQNFFKQTTILKDEDLIKLHKFSENLTSHQQDNFDFKWDANINLETLEKFKSVGSNAWIIGSKHTDTGMSILANDPHLGTMIPSLMYPFEIIIKQNDTISNQIFGCNIDGVPGFSLGVREDLAWGSTSYYADVSDVYREEIKDGKYLYDGQWKDLKMTNHSIKVRGQNPFNYTVFQTQNRVIINSIYYDILNKYAFKMLPQFPISLHSPTFEKNDTTILSLINFLYKNISFQENFKLIVSHTIDIAIIKANKEIIYHQTGKYQQKQHVCSVKDGTKKIQRKYIPFQQNIKIVNPQRDWLVMANNKFASNNIDNKASKCQFSSPRATRLQDIIVQKINKNQKISIQFVKNMMADVVDPYCVRILPSLIKLLKKGIKQYGNNQLEMIRLLQNFNCSLHKDMVEPSIFLVFQHNLIGQMLKNSSLTQKQRNSLIDHIYFDQFLYKKISQIAQQTSVKQQDYIFCGIKTHPSQNPCLTLITQTFKNLFSILQNLFSSSQLQNFKWGNIHKMIFQNMPLSQSPIGFLWTRNVRIGGNTRTVNVATHPRWQAFNSNIGSGFRLITDLNQTFFSMVTGVSDRFLSKHYDNFLQYYENDKFIEYKPSKSVLSDWTLLNIR